WFTVATTPATGNTGSEPLAAPANGSRWTHPPLARTDRPAEARAPPAPTPRALRTPHRRRAPPSTHDGVRHPRAHGLAVQPRDSGRAAGGGERRGAAGHVAIQDAHAGPVQACDGNPALLVAAVAPRGEDRAVGQRGGPDERDGDPAAGEPRPRLADGRIAVGGHGDEHALPLLAAGVPRRVDAALAVQRERRAGVRAA